MRLRFVTRTRLSPDDAAKRLMTMSAHRVPFTEIAQDGDSVLATTTLGPIVIPDNMTISPLERSGKNVRGLITKTGPVLEGTLAFAAVSTARGTIIGWEQDIRFVSWPVLDPLLAIVMRIGYGIAFNGLLKA